MNLCSQNHDEVCYEGHRCPACEIQKCYDKAVTERDEWKEEAQNLRHEVADLTRQLEDPIVPAIEKARAV